MSTLPALRVGIVINLESKEVIVAIPVRKRRRKIVTLNLLSRGRNARLWAGLSFSIAHCRKSTLAE
jgi:hypothetical protein